MTARAFAILDPLAKGPGLVLDGNLIVTTETSSLDFHRSVHGTIPKAVGDWWFTCYFSSVAQTSLAGMVSVGIAQPNSDIAKYVGEDSLAYGFLPADGVIRTNGSATVSSIPLVAERRCIGVYVHQSIAPLRCTWYVDGNQVGYVALPSGKFWVPAVTVSGGNAGEVKAELNFGIDAFDVLPYQSIT